MKSAKGIVWTAAGILLFAIREVQRKDERNVMLARSAKAKGFDAMTYIFAALLIAFALMGVSFEVILPLAAAYLLVQFYALYCRLKQEKQF